MRFRFALLITWMLVALAGGWFLQGGFGIRIPRSSLSSHVGVWVLWLWAAVLIGGGGLLVAYLVVKAIQMALPQLIKC
jgi:hypothetical protein